MELLVCTADPEVDTVLPALPLLAHRSRRCAPTAASATTGAAEADIVLVDARTDLVAARALCRLLSSAVDAPVVAVMAEGGLVALNGEWGVDEILMEGVGPTELDARLRLLLDRLAREVGQSRSTVLGVGDLVIDEETYVARLKGRPLDLTYKEFELLKYLCQHVGRVFTRDHLLQQVWGYDFFGGTRTVDVHVRRLRAKLGPDNEALIGTVRNVGYKAVAPADRRNDQQEDE